MKVLEKNSTGTILKVSEAEIYVLTNALRARVKTTGFKGIQDDCRALLDVLDNAVYQPESKKPTGDVFVPVVHESGIKQVKYSTYSYHSHELYYLPEAVKNNLPVYGFFQDDGDRMEIKRDSVYGEILRQEVKTERLTEDFISPVMTHKMYVNGVPIDYSIDAIEKGFDTVALGTKNGNFVPISRESILGKQIIRLADPQDPLC